MPRYDQGNIDIIPTGNYFTTEAGDSIGRTLRLHCCYQPASSILIARKHLLSLSRMNSKSRQGRGVTHVSPTNSSVLSLVRLYCQVFQHHRKHHANMGGGQSLKFCEPSPLSGRESVLNCAFILRPGRWQGIQSAKAHKTTLINCPPLVTICFTRESLVLTKRAHK